MSSKKYALVTGGAGDIGLAAAANLAAAGYAIALVDLDAAKVAEAAATIPGAAGLACDVTSETAVEAMLDKFGATPDVLVNNAGIGRFGPLMDMKLSDFQAVMQVNLVGAFIMARACAQRMALRGSGNIINITSINAVTPGPGSGAYPAAKAGLAKLTEQMALEWCKLGIRVNSIAPGFIDGGISKPFYADPRVRALRGGAVPSGRLGTLDDIAQAVGFLASDASSYINGHQLVVDGGVTVSLLMQLPRDVNK